MENRFEMLIAALLLGTTAVTAANAAQTGRDDAYQNARTSGLVGEKTNGYLGYVVTPPTPSIKALVEDINIKRKAVYTKAALANSATVEEMAFRNACRLISERVAPGEKYQLPAGTWETRDEGKPTLSPNCP
jgi:uncharacterized protein